MENEFADSASLICPPFVLLAWSVCLNPPPPGYSAASSIQSPLKQRLWSWQCHRLSRDMHSVPGRVACCFRHHCHCCVSRFNPLREHKKESSEQLSRAANRQSTMLACPIMAILPSGDTSLTRELVEPWTEVRSGHNKHAALECHLKTHVAFCLFKYKNGCI